MLAGHPTTSPQMARFLETSMLTPIHDLPPPRELSMDEQDSRDLPLECMAAEKTWGVDPGGRRNVILEKQ